MKKLILLTMLAVTTTAFAQNSGQTPQKTTKTSKAQIRVGDLYAGGIVVWIDSKSTAPNLHGLVCAVYDEPDSMKWEACFIAAQYMTDGDFSDWRVPTKDELNLMYVVLKQNSKGGFSDGIYWCSTSEDDDNAWYQDFSNGTQSASDDKNYKYLLRAVRNF